MQARKALYLRSRRRFLDNKPFLYFQYKQKCQQTMKFCSEVFIRLRQKVQTKVKENNFRAKQSQQVLKSSALLKIVSQGDEIRELLTVLP